MVIDEYATNVGQTASAVSIVPVLTGSSAGLMPSFFNNTDPTNTLITNFTDTTNATITGHTGSGNFWDPITQPTERLFQLGEMALEFLFGGFIVNTLNAITTSIGITFPVAWSFGFQVLIGFVNIFYIIYIVLGRSIPAFN